MTLSTKVRIIGDVSPEVLFAKAREIVGIPADQPFKIGPDIADDSDWILTRSQPGGFRAMLYMFSRRGEAAQFGARYHSEHCNLNCRCLTATSPCNLVINFDTAYAYTDDEGRDCSDLHRYLTAELGAWLDSIGCDWWAEDEYWCEWYHRTPCPLTEQQLIATGLQK